MIINKDYTCSCGKVCTNAQSFNGHKSHCKVHRLAKGGTANYEQYLSQQAYTSSLARAAKKRKIEEAEKLAQITWAAAQHSCERCGEVMLTKYGSGRFCSAFCARSRVKSAETKQKISASLSQTLLATAPLRASNKRVCSICNKNNIKNYNKTGVCKECLNTTPEGFKIKQALGRKGYDTMQVNGTHKGWQSRTITSYAENFWITVLTNNQIEYKREVPVWHGSANYFLDFVIEKNGKFIDLEIDGKQHTYQDRAKSDAIRDLFISKQGYLVYRIPWNEISSEVGKLEMQNKIDAFLEFYFSI